MYRHIIEYTLIMGIIAMSLNILWQIHNDVIKW